ncbi:LAMI_0H14268g1_1 [Lachancea mirantina]|uniref:LAMI_0H14268g1_1 n=1 Tax=Lachancea mirantina TaxID=1230905 RepID=A0A1G4KIA1_9SACH|nr:LAMI_0H14268g1_1 [Lachancea mirantina]
MVFGKVQRHHTVSTNSGNRRNEDAIMNEASLKAAQAIFKKHSSVSTNEAPQEKQNPTPARPIRRAVTVNTSMRPASKANGKVSVVRALQVTHSPPNEEKNGPSLSARQAAARAQRESAIIESHLRLPENDSIFSFSRADNKGRLSRSNSGSGSIKSGTSQRSSSSASFEDIISKLQANSSSSAAAAAASLSKSYFASRSQDCFSMSNSSSEDLRSRVGRHSPVDPRATRANQATSRNVVSKTAPRRVPPPNADNSLGDAPSRHLNLNYTSQNKSEGLFSDSETSGYGLSDDYKQDSISLSPDPTSTSTPTEVDSKKMPYEALNKMPGQVKYQGTLPDLIPNHRRDKKRGKIRSVFYRKRRSTGSEQNRSDVFHNNDFALVKTGQPVRFRTTMRKSSNDQPDSPARSSDESDQYESSSEGEQFDNQKKKIKKGHKSRIRKRIKKASGHNHVDKRSFNEDKPWKHHIDVGFVTQPERKRYEAMWVTNRNCYLSLLSWWNPETTTVPEDGLILNLVVYDIWSRSNLPQDKLAAIYDMVDIRKDGTLSRASFLVGMWLVDQSLYGRKLPTKIEKRVWDSVDRYVINVPQDPQIGQEKKTSPNLIKDEIKTLKNDLKRVQL